jgi:hypothetical protein
MMDYGISAIDTVGNSSMAAGSVKWTHKSRGIRQLFFGPDVLYVVAGDSNALRARQEISAPALRS